MRTTALLFALLASALIGACVSPPENEPVLPLRDGFPLLEIHVAAGLGEELAVANADRVAAGIAPAIVPRVLLTGSAPNRLFAQGERVWVVNSADNTVRWYDARSLAQGAPVHLGVNTNPWDITATPDGSRLLVTGFLDDTVRVLDAAGGLLARIDLPAPAGMPLGYRARPEGIAVFSNRAFVALTGYSFAKGNFDPGALAVLDIAAADPAAWTVETTIVLQTNPQAVLVLPEAGEVHVSCSGVFGKDDGHIVILDAVSLAVLTNLPVGGAPYRLAHDSVRGLVYIGGGNRIGWATGRCSPRCTNCPTRTASRRPLSMTGGTTWCGSPILPGTACS
jgi:hypothetical protein